MSEIYKMGNWWINKEEWDFYTNWYKNREIQLKEWQNASDEEKKELLKVYYKEIMKDEYGNYTWNKK